MNEKIQQEHSHKKSKNRFLNNESKKKDSKKIDKDGFTQKEKEDHKLKTNIFSNEIGKNVLKENQVKREIDINNDELFPSLLDDSITYISKKKTKTKSDTEHGYTSYLSIAKREESTKKEITYEVDPGWVHLFKTDDNKIHFLYGPTTEKCLELEKKEYEAKLKKERNELYKYLEELEYERHLRKELYKDIYNFYEPSTDKYYTKEEDIVIYTSTSNDLSDSDTEGSFDYNENDYDTVNNTMFD